jgi:hypothetical protein
MASSSSTKLTKYESAVTIVTAAVANSWFGGLYGSSEGEAYDSTDPLVAGHVHDGSRVDGHAQKINLVTHVTGQLRNVNLGLDAVNKRNVDSFVDQGQAIPESELIDGTTYYYLDLSAVYAAIEDSFQTINITANGGTVDGDGAGTIVADQAADTLNLEAGANITLTRTAASDTIKITGAAGSAGNSFETQTVAASGGSASGGPVAADNSTDTLNWVAGPGMIFNADAGTDTITVSRTNTFGDVGTAQAGRGASNGTNIPADATQDTVTFTADDGMEINGDAGADTVTIRNRFAFSHNVQEIASWAADDQGGWGSIANTSFTESGEEISYKYFAVEDNEINTYVPIPQSLLPERPISFIFRAYFIAFDVSTSYLLGTQPTFNIDCQFGSRAGQPTNNVGVTGDDDSILANTGAGIDYWAPGTPIVLSKQVIDSARLYVVDTPLQTISGAANNPLGLMGVRMKGQAASFATGGTNPFDGHPGRATLHFIKSDITWFI